MNGNMIAITSETRAQWEATITTVSNLIEEHRTSIRGLVAVKDEIRCALVTLDAQEGKYNAAADATAQLD